MKIFQTNFHGDHNLGLYGKASARFCLIGNFVTDKDHDRISEMLGVKLFRTTAANTDLAGMFFAINSNGILFPKITTEKEKSKLRILKKELGLNICELKTKYTALGNLILANDKGAVVPSIFSRLDVNRIKDILGVEVENATVAAMKILGSAGIATNKGCLVHRDASEEETKRIEEILKVKVDIGSANFGSPFVGACMIGNDKGAIIGDSTTGPEVTRIMESLNLL
ncbi:MAG: translation initiation factor IF-6 [Candidatus Aenigmatarchaeota archaeon]